LLRNAAKVVRLGLLAALLSAWLPAATVAADGSVTVPILNPPQQAWFPVAPALPPAPDDRVEVSTVEELIRAIEEARPGQTILVADGHYRMPRYVEICANRVTLRGASGHRERVVLDGVQSMHGELLGFRSCSDVTVADLTIQNIRYNGFKINSDSGVQRLTIRNCIIHNIWQRGVKGVKVPEEDRETLRPKGCRIQYCLFYNDRPKRLADDPHDIAQGNYIAGIDVMYAKAGPSATTCSSGFRAGPSKDAARCSSGSTRRIASSSAISSSTATSACKSAIRTAPTACSTTVSDASRGTTSSRGRPRRAS
jgi:hypothetical protein